MVLGPRAPVRSRWVGAEIYALPGPWDAKRHRHPASSRHPNRCDPGFFILFLKKRWHHSWAVPYEKLQVTSAFGPTTLSCGDHTSHSLFPSFFRSASFSLQQHGLNKPPSPTVASLLSHMWSRCRTPAPRACRRSTTTHPCYLSLLENLGSTPTSVSQTARSHWGPLHLHSRSSPTVACSSPPRTALSSTRKPDPRGLKEAIQEIVELVYLL